MDYWELDEFIVRLAKKIALIHSNGCADEDDYIQVGYLKLVEIIKNKTNKRNFKAYAIISIARSMRRFAIESKYPISASYRIKKLASKAEVLLNSCKTESEICDELGINAKTLANLRSLITDLSWRELFDEPVYNFRLFPIVDDVLSSNCLTDNDRVFIKSQINDDGEFTRKQKWTRNKKLKQKLIRSGYGN